MGCKMSKAKIEIRKAKMRAARMRTGDVDASVAEAVRTFVSPLVVRTSRPRDLPRLVPNITFATSDFRFSFFDLSLFPTEAPCLS